MLALAMSGNFGSFGAAASGEVLALQQALKMLASVASYPVADPGETDGIVGQNTVMALAMWAAKIPKLPSEVGTILQVAGAGWSFLPDGPKQTAIDTITRFAKDITVGVLALAAVYTATTSPPAPPPAAVPNPGYMTQAYHPRLPAPATAGKYKAGSVARFNVTRKVWSIYSPLAGGYGLGVSSDGRCIGGSCLGSAEVNPPVPFNTVKAGEEIVPPAGVTHSGAEEDAAPFYKRPYFWLAVGGGAVVVGGGYAMLRRRKA
jgi:hypothetical protein